MTSLTILDDTIKLRAAVRMGQLELIKTCLDQKPLLSTILYSYNFLHLAVSYGQVEVARLLIEHYKYHVDCRSHRKQTPLHIACSKGHLNMVRMLIKKYKAKVTLCDESNDTPLHEAARCGQTEIVLCLISEFKCNPSLMGSKGKTILHHACCQGHTNLVELLCIQVPELLFCTDNDGNVPLHDAVCSGSNTVVRLLITKYKWVEFRNHSKQTPLHLACARGHVDIVKMLVIECKADLNVYDGCGLTPLHKATLFGQIKVIGCLLKEFKCDPNTTKTLLHYACRQGSPNVVEYLLDQHNLYINDDNGNTPLHYAILGGNEGVVKLLITKYNFSPSCANKNKETPLDIACSEGQVHLVGVLVIEHKADMIHSALHVAAWHGPTLAMTDLITKLKSNPYIIMNVDLNYNVPNGKEGYKRDLRILDNSTQLLDQSQAPLNGSDKGAALLLTKYTPKRSPSNSIIRIFIIEHKPELNSAPLYEGVCYGHTEIIEFLINQLTSTMSVLDDRTILNLASLQGLYIELIEAILTQYNMHPLYTDNNGSRNTLLHCAARDGREDIVKLFITKYKCSANVRNKNNQTPLHLACSTGQVSTVRMLVTEHKANLYIQDKDNNIPMHLAAWYGHTNVVKCLIDEFSCNPNTKGFKGRNILHNACYQGHANLVKLLLTAYLDILSIDDSGNTSLHLAALGGRENVVKLLITKYGCTADCRNNIKQSPLHLACSSGHIRVVRTLLSECKVATDLYLCDIDNNTPLHTAVVHGQMDAVDCLINEFDCSTDVKGANGCSLLHIACQQGYLELIKRLVTEYKLDPMIGDDNGNTPLHYAALADRSEVATLLITKYGSPVNQLNNNNETPLHLVCTKGHLNLVQTLIKEHIADINICDINNHTPLQKAALSGQTEVVHSLVREFSCDPKVTGVQERNLLHYACLHDHDALAKKLIDSFHLSLISADINGNSPLHISAMFGQNKCVHMLLHDYHAPLYLRNNSGKSALEVARDMRTKKIIDTYLKEEYDRIQYDYKMIQTLSKKKYSGAQRLTRVFVLGNVQSGKSTLIESLKRQGFLYFFYQISEAIVPPHTSGIIPSEYCDRNIGRVLYYDFAGDPEYYSSHSAIMSSVMQSKQGTNVCLVIVNLQKEDKYILEELGYWFSFISFHCKNTKEKCKVLTIGSHIDLVTKTKVKRKVALVSEFTKNYLSCSTRSPIEVVKSKIDLVVNCCKPRSSRCVSSALNQIVKTATTFRLSEEAAILLGLLEKDFKNVITCKVQTLLTHIMETGVYLPNIADSLYPIVMELHTVGILLVIESKSGKLEDYLMLLNILKLTNEVHKILFSKDSAKKFLSSTDPCSASMGILPQTYLKSILPEYITTECLIQLQYCQEFSHAEVKFDYSVMPTKNSSGSTLLYFPALCETERKRSIQTPENYGYNIGWYLKCCGKFDYLPPRFLHVLLLRLAHTFALPAAYDQPSNPIVEDATGIHLYNRRCTMWKNGIHWLMTEGVECYVENVNNSKGIVIVTKSKEVRKFICTKILFNIIQEIHQAKEEFCETVTLQEYLMDSNDPGSFNDECKLFLISDQQFIQVLSEGNPLNVIVSINGKNSLDAEKILHLAQYIHWDFEKEDVVIACTIPVAPNIKLSERHQSVLSLELKTQSTEWKNIAVYLGFASSELNIIEAKPLLLIGAPTSWLNEMLSEWLQWAPGDTRGSTKNATLEGLRDALDKAGLGGTIIASKICHGLLLDCLIKNKLDWRELSEFLGFHPSELGTIQEKSHNVPETCLSTMLTEWLRWAPGDKRGSTKSASLEGLRDALNKAGLAETAQSVMALEPAT